MLIPNFYELPAAPLNRDNWPWVESIQTHPEMMFERISWPKISIVTPSYNQGQFLEEAIRSILLQQYPNLEYFIIDGGSVDNSVEIIKKYEPWLTYWTSEPDRGQSHAINKGIQKASGEILFWLNSDDLCLPYSFYKIAQAFLSSSRPALVIGQARVIDSQGKTTGELNSHFKSWGDLIVNPRNTVRQVSTFFSRELFSELGLVDERLNIAMDTELLIRFTQFHKPMILDDYLTAYRVHANAKTTTQLIRGYEESDRVRAKYFPNRKLADIYYRRSAQRWLQMSRSNNLTRLKRVTCLMNAVQNQPSILLTRKFAASVKRLLVGK